MFGFSNNSIIDLEKIINQSIFKKFLIISGKKSYNNSGAKNLIKKILKDKEVYLFLKRSPYPEINELKKIILHIERVKPDLIIAIGGGSVIDYAKISNTLKVTLGFMIIFCFGLIKDHSCTS